MNAKLAGLLGMAKRAGKMAVGFDETVTQTKKGKAYLIVMAADLSPKSEKEWRFAVRNYPIAVRHLPMIKTELAHTLGLARETGLAAVCDEGFAKAIAALCPEDDKED